MPVDARCHCCQRQPGRRPLPAELPRRRAGGHQCEQFAWIGIALFLIVAAAAALKIYLGRRLHFRDQLLGQHHRDREELTPVVAHCQAGERGSISVTGIVVFFALLFYWSCGTNWVDDDLALGAFRTVVSEAAQTRCPRRRHLGGRKRPATEAAARAETDLISGRLPTNITITCTLELLPSGAELLVAVAAGTLPNWVVPVTVHVHVVAQVPVEVSPTQPSTVDP